MRRARTAYEVCALVLMAATASAQSPAVGQAPHSTLRYAGPVGQELVQTPPPQRAPGLTLDQATSIALTNSPALREAQARVEQARGRAYQASLYPNPQQNSGNPLQLGGTNSTYSAGVTQEVIMGGKRGLQIEAANQAVRQAELAFARQRFELLTDVRQEFYTLLAAQARAEILETLLATAQQSEITSRKLVLAGEARTGDLLQLRIELRRAEAALQSARYGVTANARQLAALLGTPTLQIPRVVGDLTPDFPNFDDVAIQRAVLARNPIIASAQTEINRNRILLQRAEKEPIPNLTFQGGYQYTVNAPHSQGLVGTYFTIPLWDRNQGNIRAAAATVSESTAQLGSAQNDLLRRVADALGRYHSAQKTIDAFEQSILPDARENLKVTRQALAQGQIDLLRLLQAQRSLFEANLDYIAAELNEVTAAAEIAGLLQQEKFP